MALPNPGMDAVPFTPLTAEFLDDMIENIQALSAGTGLANGAITTNTLAESAVTLQKLGVVSTSGMYLGTKNVTSSSSAYTPVPINGGPSVSYQAVSGKKYRIMISSSFMSAPTGELGLNILRPNDSVSFAATVGGGGGNMPVVGVLEYTETQTTSRTVALRIYAQAVNVSVRVDNPRIEVQEIS